MDNNCVLTIDVGSSSIRVTLFDEQLKSLCSLTEKIKAEIRVDMNEYWKIIYNLLKQIINKNPNCEVKGIGVSALVGWVFVDIDGNCVEDAYTWMDQKEEQKEDFLSEMDSAMFYFKTGRKISAELGGLKLKYMKDNSLSKYDSVRSMLTIKDYINCKLTGKFCMDYTSACYSMLFNIHTFSWDFDLVKALKVDLSKLPKLKKSTDVIGPVKQSIASELGLIGTVAVTACGPDGSIASLGAGAVELGDGVNVMGTSDVFFAVHNQPVLDEKQRIVANPHVLPGYWLIGGPLGMSGGTIDWFVNDLFEKKHSMSELTDLAKMVSPGSEGVLVIPGLTGERTPFWNADIRGTVCGLTRSHRIQHLFRATLEANSYTVRHIIDIIAQNINVRRIIAIGGGTNSDLWLNIKSAVTKKTILVPQMVEATTLGCAILANMAVTGKKSTLYKNIRFAKTILPNAEAQNVYDNLYVDYLTFIDKLSAFYTINGYTK